MQNLISQYMLAYSVNGGTRKKEYANYQSMLEDYKYLRQHGYECRIGKKVANKGVETTSDVKNNNKH